MKQTKLCEVAFGSCVEEGGGVVPGGERLECFASRRCRARRRAVSYPLEGLVVRRLQRRAI